MTRCCLAVRSSVVVYRALLLVYPSSFTQEFGDPMVWAYQDLVEDAASQGGLLGLARTWPGVVVDLLLSASAQHWDNGWGRISRWTVAGFVLGVPALVFWLSVFFDIVVGSELARRALDVQSTISPAGQASLWLGLPGLGLVAELFAARQDGRSALSLGGIGVNGFLVLAIVGAATLRVS
jgi:hypothetical protein